MAGCTRGARADRRSLSAATSTRIRARDHRPHARDRHRDAEQPERRGVPRGRAARRSTRSAASAACTTSATRSTSTSPTDRRATCRRDRFAGAARAHDLDVLAVEGLRLRRLAHRLHGLSGAPARRRSRRARTRSWSARRWSRRSRRSPRSTSGRAYCEPHVRELAEIRDIVVSRAVGARAARTVPAGRRRVLLLLKVEHGDSTR